MLIRLTGLVTIEDQAAQSRHLSSAQAQVAFARLTLERANGTGRDQLADTVWPDGLPDTWASALRSVVSRVRAFVAHADPVDEPTVISQGGRYLLRLPPDATVDLELAESAVGVAAKAFTADDFVEARRLASTAVSCLRRPFLPDHEGEWVTGVRQRLDELLVAGLETASLASSAFGEHGEALRYADEAVQRAPLRESAHRCRMAAHVAAGNRAEALRAYNRLQRVLAEELGVDPAPETQALYLELLAAPAAAAGPAATSRFRFKPGAAAPFVGRRPELAMLAECWAQAETGDSSLVLITGEPGIGKTRLTTAAASRVGLAGGVVLHGRCDPAARQPFQPIVEALAGFVAATPVDALPALGDSAGRTLAALADTGQSPTASPNDQLAALTDVLVRLARACSVFLVLDDLDLAGEDTLVLLRQLLRRRRGASLLVVATAASPVQHPPAFASAVRDLDREGYLLRTALTGLSESDVATLARQVVPAQVARSLPSPRRLIVDTAGNPYLLLDLIRWYCDSDDPAGRPDDEELPSGIHDYASERLAALVPAPRHLLTAAALAGRSFELDLTASAAQLPAAEALDALDVLIAAGLVRPVGGGTWGYQFCHDVLRRAVGARCNTDRRRVLHRRFVDAIETYRIDDLDRYSEALARHSAAVAAGSGDARAVRWGWAAGSRAGSDGALNEAVRLHRLALDHVPADEPGLRAEALTNLGLAQLSAGHGGAEQTLFDGALQALHGGRPDIAARGAIGLADAVDDRSRLRGEAVALVEALLRRPAQQASHRAGRARRAKRADHNSSGALDDLIVGRLLARHHRLGGRVGKGPATTAAIAALSAELCRLGGPGQLELRAALAEDMADVADAVGDKRARVTAAHHLATAAELTGRGAVRDRALAVLAAEADGSRGDGSRGDGDLVADALLVDHAVAVALTQGRFTDAVATARLVVPALAGTGRGITPQPGSLAARQMHVAGWLRAASWPVTGGRGGGALAELSLTALVAGERGRSHLTVRALANGAEELPAGDEWLHAAGLLALGAVELGDPTTADAVRARLAPHANLVCGVGYRSFVGPVSFHLGRLSVLVGDWAAAERHLTNALSMLGDRRARPWSALAQLALARALRGRARSGDRCWAQALEVEARSVLAGLGLPQDIG